MTPGSQIESAYLGRNVKRLGATVGCKLGLGEMSSLVHGLAVVWR